MPSDTPGRHEPPRSFLLSPLESMFWRLEESSHGIGRVILLFQLHGCIEASYLLIALREVQRRHPKLQAAVTEGVKGRLHYEFTDACPPIPFEIRDYTQEESPWREEARRLLALEFPARGPFAAVTVLRNRSRSHSDLLLTVHHAIADGLSAIMLVDDLLTEYANAEQNLQLPTRPALPAFTAANAKSSRKWRDRGWVFRRFVQIQRQGKRSRPTPLPESAGIAPQSQWAHWILSREDTWRFVRRCRMEKTSVSEAMVSAVCCGLLDCLPLEKALFKCQFPFNLREELAGPEGPVTDRDLGCFVSMMNELFEVHKNLDFWRFARYVREKVEGFVQHGGPSFCYNLASFLKHPLFVNALRRLPGSGTRITLLATSYGLLNVRDVYGSLRPRGCTLTFKNNAEGPWLVMEGLVMAQQLNIGFVAEGLEPAFWQQLQLAVRKHLDMASLQQTGPAISSGRTADQNEDAPHRISVAAQE